MSRLDLLAVRELQLHKDHALHNLRKIKTVPDMMKSQEFFAGKSVREVQEMLRRR